MRLNLKALWLVPALLASACGPTTPESQPGEQPAAVDAVAQGVLYAPPAPASGNIVDSTAYLGAVAVPGSVQTRFTTHPQYLSFSFNVAAGAQMKLEVTHLGSSMYLDTGLFVYGPKSASGSYGTTVLAQDDDAGYGQLSKVASVTLPQRGEYLVVVSTGTGAGKQFRLQLDCLNGACDPVDPSVYATCDRAHVGPSVEECMSQHNAEGVPTDVAFADCFGADDAHFIYGMTCYEGSTTEWCAGGEAAWTEQMWPVCVDYYQHHYGLYTLDLSLAPVSANLQSQVDAGNTACGYLCSGSLTAYSFPWTSTAQPEAYKASEALAMQYEFQDLDRYGTPVPSSLAEFKQALGAEFGGLSGDLLSEYGNGTEQVRVERYSTWRETAPDVRTNYDVYVLLFPESHHVLGFRLNHTFEY